MFKPAQIEQEAKKKEIENIKFRSFLKNHADEEKLDQDFARLHKVATKHMPCDFLEEDGSCKLGDCRPDNCKKYPYTDQPDRLWSLYSVLEAVEVCPVAFEIFERLKREYGFRSR